MAACFQPTISSPGLQAIKVDDRTPQARVVAVGHAPVVEVRTRIDAVLQCRAFKVDEIAAEVLSLAADVKERVRDFGRVGRLYVLAVGWVAWIDGSVTWDGVGR